MNLRVPTFRNLAEQMEWYHVTLQAVVTMRDGFYIGA